MAAGVTGQAAHTHSGGGREGVNELPRGLRLALQPAGQLPGAAHPEIDDALARNPRLGGVTPRAWRQDNQSVGAGRSVERGPREQPPAAGVVDAVNPNLRARPVQGGDGGLQLSDGGDGGRVVAPASCRQRGQGGGRGMSGRPSRHVRAAGAGSSGRGRQGGPLMKRLQRLGCRLTHGGREEGGFHLCRRGVGGGRGEGHWCSRSPCRILGGAARSAGPGWRRAGRAALPPIPEGKAGAPLAGAQAARSPGSPCRRTDRT